MDSNSALEIDDLVLRIERLIKRNEKILGEYEINDTPDSSGGYLSQDREEELTPANMF